MNLLLAPTWIFQFMLMMMGMVRRVAEMIETHCCGDFQVFTLLKYSEGAACTSGMVIELENYICAHYNQTPRDHPFSG